MVFAGRPRRGFRQSGRDRSRKTVCPHSVSNRKQRPLEPIENQEEHVILRVRVQPKASRNALCLEPDGRIRVALTSPPVEGAANKALTKFMAKQLKVAHGAIRLISGEKSRDKTLSVAGLTAAEVRARLVGD